MMTIDGRADGSPPFQSGASPSAGFWIRSGGALIDFLAVIAVFYIFGGAFRLTLSLFSIEPSGGSDFEALAILVLFPTTYYGILVGRFGRTFGMLLAGTGIIRTDGEKVGYFRAIGRALALLLEPFLLFFGCVVGAFTPQKRMLHDYAAGTRVVCLGSISSARKSAMVFLGVCFPFVIAVALLRLAIPVCYPIH